MPASAAFLNAAAAGGVAAITHIGLVDDTGAPLAGARQAVAWAADGTGVQRPTTDETFDVAAGETVGGWRGYSAAAAGTDFGGEDLDEETYTNAGTYLLESTTTGYQVALPA